MIVNKINVHKITKAFELVCLLHKEKLITEAYIVGSVAKGTAKEDSDIDIYLTNPLFEYQFNTHQIDLPPSHHKNDIYIKKITDKLKELKVEPHYIELETKITEEMWYWFYKDEFFHFMYDYESESIRKAGEYIEITKELCNEINEI